MNKMLIKNFFIITSLIVSMNSWLTNGLPIVDYNDDGNQTYSCQRTMTLKQIVQLLKQQPCAQLMDKESRPMKKRNTDGGNMDIHALQTTINDHRTMINYLINNSLNATFVTDAISSHHSKTGPILSSWRDLIDLFTVTLFIGFLVYFCLCRAGCTSCDRILSFFCKQSIARIHNQQQEQQQATHTEKSLGKTPSHRERRRPQQHLSVASVADDIGHFHNGYMSE